MRLFVWLLSCGLILGQQQSVVARTLVQKVDKPKPEQKLELNTTILNARYCSASSNLVLNLRLSFTNVGNGPILLQKKSVVISRHMVSRSLLLAKNKKYSQDARYEVDWRAAGFSLNSPELSEFVKLSPGESFSTERRVPLAVFETKENLQPGKYFLQVVVPTWYFLPEWIDDVRTRWKEVGFVWTEIAISNPMPFEVERRPVMESCADLAQ